MMRKGRFESYALVAGVVALLLVATVSPGAEADSSDCFASDENNTGILDVTTDPAEILAGKKINGTAGYIILKNLPTTHNYTLRAPDGSTVGPVEARDGEALFHEVPLCITGEWTVVDAETGVDLSHFFTTTSGAGGSSSIIIDYVVNVASYKDYYAGWMSADNQGSYCNFRGEAHPTGYRLVESLSVRVHASWSTDYRGLFADRAGFFTIIADGDEGTQASTVGPAVYEDSGKVSVRTWWTAVKVYKVQMEGKTYRASYYLDSWCSAAGTVQPYT